MRQALVIVGALLIPTVVLGGMQAARRDPAKPNWVLPTQMAQSPAYPSQSANPILANHMTMQPPVEETLARGEHAFHYAKTDAERRRAGNELANPFLSTPENLATGKRLYDTYCAVCHGGSGGGDGPVIPKYPNPPNFRSKQCLKLRDGDIFHTITLGRKKMPSHAAQLSWDERWQVILYIHSLQKGKPS
jgi:mono/diheme cytochrome c family protein